MTLITVAFFGFLAAALLLVEGLPVWGRTLLAAGSLIVALVLARALRFLRELGRAVTGLAARQRELARRLSEKD